MEIFVEELHFRLYIMNIFPYFAANFLANRFSVMNKAKIRIRSDLRATSIFPLVPFLAQEILDVSFSRLTLNLSRRV